MSDSIVTFAGIVLAGGIIATLCDDLWQLAVARVRGSRAGDWSKVGRWACGLLRGQFRHDSPETLPDVAGANAIGWVVHYLTGFFYSLIYFAAMVVLGLTPSLGNAMIFALLSLVAPFLWMKPSMGLGWFGLKSPTPVFALFSTISTHLVFGVGLSFASLMFWR